MKLPQSLNPTWLVTHRDAALFTGSSVLKTAAQFAASLVTVRFVAPADLGLWNTVSLATTYALLLQGGVINGLSRELPFQLGAGRKDEAERLAGTAQSYTALACLASLVAGAAGMAFFASGGTLLLTSIAAVTVVTALTFYQNYLSVTFRSNRSFLNLSKVQAWGALLLLVTVPAISLWHYRGMMGRVVLLTIATGLMLHAVRPMRVSLLWDWPAFKSLWAVGLPIFVLAYINGAAGTVDRAILAGTGGLEQVGFYSLALYTWQAFTMVPLSLATYIYPKMTFAWGKSGNPKELRRMAWKTAVLMLGLMGPLALAGWFLLPPVAAHLFPRYREGVFAAQITLVSAVFYGAVIGVNALWSMKAWKYMAGYQISTSALLVGGAFLGARTFENPLTGVSVGMLFARAATLVIGMGAIYLATRGPIIFSDRRQDASPAD